MKKILIDSDVCLDLITVRYPFFQEANRLFSLVENGNFEGVISADSFSNIYYILRKFSNSSKAREQIKNLRKITNVGEIRTSSIDSALASEWNDFEDAIQHACAVENECDAIISRNKQDYKKAELPVLTAMEFLQKISE